MKNVLIVTDMQNGFINKNTRNITSKIKSLIEKNLFDYIVFTQFINVKNSPYERLLNWRELKSSPQIDIIEWLRPYCQNLFKKNCYSPFTKEFEQFLKKKNIKELYFVGADTNICITRGAVDAFERSYTPYILSDYCASHSGNEFHDFALKNLEKLIGKHHIIPGEVNEIK